MHSSNRSGNARVGSRLALILVSAFASCAWADATFDLEKLSPDQLLVAPGESTIYSMRIHNTGDVAGPASVVGTFHLLNRFGPDPYTLGPPGDARCGSIEVDNFATLSFVTASIAAGTALDCEWQINRPLASRFDTWLAWHTAAAQPSSSGLTVIGTLTDTSITTRTLSFSIDDQGIGHAGIELSVHNGGQFLIDEQSAGACYGGFVDAVVLAGEGEESCGDEYYSPPCFTGGGYGFAIPDLQPGQTHRCTFKMRSLQPYSHPLAADFRVETEQYSEHDTMLLDSNESDNHTLARLAPVSSGDTTELPTLRWPALALLIFIFGFLGLRGQRRMSL